LVSKVKIYGKECRETLENNSRASHNNAKKITAENIIKLS